MTTWLQNNIPEKIVLPGMRLCAAAYLCSARLPHENAEVPLRAIDVGADHARLSVFLIQSGICSHVIATDINDGPVNKARENLNKRTLKGESLSKYIEVIKTDGLCGLENTDANRVIIAGMGGELIIDILKRAAFVCLRKNEIKLILQPQSREYDLREYLYFSGYLITDEMLVLDKSRIYSVMSVVFDGQVRKASPMELYMGKIILKKKDGLFVQYLNRKLSYVEDRLCAKKNAGLGYSDDEALLSEMKAYEKTL